jgi:hypothetical protein
MLYNRKVKFCAASLCLYGTYQWLRVNQHSVFRSAVWDPFLKFYYPFLLRFFVNESNNCFLNRYLCSLTAFYSMCS